MYLFQPAVETTMYFIELLKTMDYYRFVSRKKVKTVALRQKMNAQTIQEMKSFIDYRRLTALVGHYG